MEATLNARAAPLTGSAVADPRDRRPRFRLRHVRDRRAGHRRSGPMLMELGPFQPGTPNSTTGPAIMLFLPVVIGGIGRAGRRLSDRSARTAARAGVEHRALRHRPPSCPAFATSLRRAHLLALHHGRRRLRGVRRGHRLAHGAVSRTRRREAVLGFAQVCATLGNFMIAGAYYAAVTWGDQLAGGARRAFGLALRVAVRRAARDSADHPAALPARIAGVAGETRRGHACAGRAFASCSRRGCGA